jgi:hypothetical protein
MTDTMPCTRVPSAARLKHWLAAGFIALLASTAATAQTRAALVKDVDSPASQPFAASSGVVNFPAGSSNASSTLLTVPAGKRAILEHVSCIDFLETGNNFVRMEMRYTLGGVAQRHQFVHTRVGTSLIGSIDVWSFSQPVRLYADAGTILQMAALRRSTTGSGGIECQISGHYVDAP